MISLVGGLKHIKEQDYEKNFSAFKQKKKKQARIQI